VLGNASLRLFVMKTQIVAGPCKPPPDQNRLTISTELIPNIPNELLRM